MGKFVLYPDGETMIPMGHVIAILDAKTIKPSHGALYLAAKAAPQTRSIIVTHACGKTGVHLSKLSAQTLLRRHQGVKT